MEILQIDVARDDASSGLSAFPGWFRQARHRAKGYNIGMCTHKSKLVIHFHDKVQFTVKSPKLALKVFIVTFFQARCADGSHTSRT